MTLAALYSEAAFGERRDRSAAAELERLRVAHDAAQEQVNALLAAQGPRSTEYLAALTERTKLWVEMRWLQR